MEYRKPRELKSHPISQQIYGDNNLDERFVEDIKEHGIRQPLIISQDNVIISGHRRWRVATLLELASVPVEVIPAFTDDIEEKRAILANNLQREKVYSQKMKEAEYWKVIEVHDAKLRQELTSKYAPRNELGQLKPTVILEEPSGLVGDIVGKRVGIGAYDTFHKAEKVWQGAKDGNPVAQKLVQQLDAGSVSIKKAHRILTNKAREEERTSQRKAEALSGNYSGKILLGDISKWEQDNAFGIEQSTVDVIITDPPYPKEYLPLFGYLASFSKYILKPNGSLFVMVRQSYLPDIISALSKQFAYHWVLSYLTPGGQAPQLWDRKVNSFWKPILWFVKGEYQGKWMGDVVKSDVNDNDKDFHEWGQSESGMADLIKRVTEPNDLILDPFVGGGTTGKVALDLGRRFIGIDKSEDSIAIARQRLGEI